ncbi:GNAT family N-acetyltransferase [Arthrobacter halodurans]|uniref:GNAT family N-acetyltransferase n=1 Tax=Arthrobacter halodurans TaxID=516699 RepID=A0ABV4UNR6_9MICC
MNTAPATVTVRHARPGDYAEIARITVDSYLHAGHFDDPTHPYLGRVRQVADRHDATDIWVAERDGRVVGSVTVVRHGNEYADVALEHELEFRMLVVDPAAQRSGAGAALLDAVVAHARTLEGVSAVSLTTGRDWAAAHALYRKAGFRHVPERDWYVPDTDILLLVFVLDL